MAVPSTADAAAFDPSSVGEFRFLARELTADGRVSLRYALDELTFEEQLRLPLQGGSAELERPGVEGLLSLLHWVAGVSYFKAALPARVRCETGAPPPGAAALLRALYSEGLGELAYTNGVPIPRPAFTVREAVPPPAGASGASRAAGEGPRRVLVPVGGGKDSAVAIEVVRAAGVELSLFSIGDALPIARTAQVAGLPRLVARRKLDPALIELNARGAINGHVPVTAIVSCVALLTAALNGYDAVAMANERSASAGNLVWDGVEVNHQFSKGLVAERLLSAAAAETGAGVACFSVLRAASELAIARAFARLTAYHDAFTSCNAVFRLDPARRGSSWCGDCPKCRFVFLVLAPFMAPARLRELFDGRDLLAEEAQYEGFALLLASGGHKPFECVGEERESHAAVRALARDPRWREHAVVRRLLARDSGLAGGPGAGDEQGGPSGDGGDAQATGSLAGADDADAGVGSADFEELLALSDEHDVPQALQGAVDALLGA